MNWKLLWCRIKGKLLWKYWNYKHQKYYPYNCGYECDWVYPYGFVPEADCPIHDRE